MTQYEPLSITATVLLLIGFVFGGFLGLIVLIVGAILLSQAYTKFKKSPKKYKGMWIIYTGTVILVLSILIKLLAMFI